MSDDVDIGAPDPGVDHDAVPSPSARRSRLAPIIAMAIALVIAGLFVVFARSDPNKADAVETRFRDKPAPELIAPLERLDANGATVDGTFNLARRKGSWVVLNFFDRTCEPCVAEHPALVSFYNVQQRLPAEQRVELYSVVWGNDRPGSRDYLREHDAAWPVVLDDGTMAARLGVAKVPETWVIDPHGIVRARFQGELTTEGLSGALATMQGVTSLSVPEQ